MNQDTSGSAVRTAGRAVDTLVRRQDGVLGRAQALRCGLSRATIDRRLADRLWLPVYPRVYLVAGWAWSPAARTRAAMQWAGEATLIADTAAWWTGLLSDWPGGVTLAVRPGRRLVAPDGVTVAHRRIADQDRTRHLGLAVTARALTVLDAAVALEAAGPAFLDRCLQRRVTLAELRAAHWRSLGRRGSRAAGDLLVRAADRTASEAERRVVAVLRAAGLTGWSVNLPVWLPGYGDTSVDIAFAEARVAVEIDGWAWHSDAARFQSDRRRQNALVCAGWIVLRFTWLDLTQRPGQVVREIRRVVDARQ